MAKNIEHKVEYRKLSDLTPLENNPRWIKEEDFDKLCASIQNNPELFEAQPIILSDRTGEMVIIAGNQRYRAAQTVGLKEVPTVLLSGLTEQKEKEIIIRTNITNGKWDWDRLANDDWNVDDLGDWGLECDFLNPDENGELDDFFEEAEKEKKEEKQADIVLSIHIPAEEEDVKDEIVEVIKTALESYPNITIK